jgi:FtsZ-interacting cell division protein ZipA
MLSLLPILTLLAKGSSGSPPVTDADSSIKFIFGGIVVVIWIVGGIMSQMKKKADRERWNNPQPQQDWSHLLRDLTAGQNKPFTPQTPAPPHLQPQPPPQQQQNRQPMQQTKSFAQQSPRPFVQQYRPQPPRRPAPMRPSPMPRRTIQPPKPIAKRHKAQRRPPPVPAQALATRTPQAQVGLIPDSAVTMGQAGSATSLTASTARTGAPRVTRSQLRKLILWSEVLAPPLSLREDPLQ